MIKYAFGLALATSLLLAGCSSNNDEPKNPTPVKAQGATPRPALETIEPVVLSFFAVNNSVPSNIDTTCAGDLFYASELSDESLIKMVELAGEGPLTDEGRNTLSFEEEKILATLVKDANENCVG